MDIREKVARAIAQARHLNCDPDDRVCPFRCPDIGNSLTLLPPETHIRPLWTAYTHEADVAIAAIAPAESQMRAAAKAICKHLCGTGDCDRNGVGECGICGAMAKDALEAALPAGEQ